MKEYLTREQTNQLIQMGCKTEYPTFRLSEMLALMPLGIEQGRFIICNTGTLWSVSYCYDLTESNKELIDALFNMYIKLKERNLL